MLRRAPAASLALFALAVGCQATKHAPRDQGSNASVVAPDAGDAAVAVPVAAEETKTISIEGGPTVRLRPASAASIEVKLEYEYDLRVTWTRVEIERRRVGVDESVRQRDVYVRPGGLGETEEWRRHEHTAAQGAAYAYRARTAEVWSAEVTIRIPAPRAVPAAPTSIAVKADSPFATRVTWESRAEEAAGFEVEVGTNGNFVRAGLIDPNKREFTHHQRLPGQHLEYRVRAFNSLGASAPSAVASAITPAIGPSAKSAELGECIRDMSPWDGCMVGVFFSDKKSGKKLLLRSSGQGCTARQFIGKHEGCNRDLGSTWFLDADPIEGLASEGWPLLRTTVGKGQSGGDMIQTMQFVQGRYSVVDASIECGSARGETRDPSLGEVNADLRLCAPPFEACHYDRAPR